jgi:hypothetical protein
MAVRAYQGARAGRTHVASPPTRSAPALRRSPSERAIGNQARLRQVQAKLDVGAADHPLEREADAVADTVMRMPDPALAPAPAITRAEPLLSRKCAACEDEEGQVQRAPASAPAPAGFDATAIAGEGLGSPGAPLDGAVRSFFEPRFGRDFSGVRVHTGPAAARSARALGARAYTVGSDLVFAEGQFAPANEAGRRLLAHELTHTIQQGAVGGAPTTLVRSPALGISSDAGALIQRVGECAGYSYKTCGGQACVPNSGKGTGFCRWSGTIANGCICIPIEQPMLRRFVETVLMAALAAIGIYLAVEAVLAIVACFASGACELAALIAVLGMAGAMLVVKLLPGSGAASGPSASADTPAAAPDAAPAADTGGGAAPDAGGTATA